ncbi:MAG: nitroreductase family protein [Lachnospiraceae bacterium]|nr:nitroreductase family protein [Lachnospiraceae bacterium]
MDFEKLIQERRSVRSYSDRPVPRELLDKIVKEAQMAPSWKNMQTSRVYVVESAGMLEGFRERALPDFNIRSSKNAALIVTAFVRNEVGFSNGQPVTELGNKWGAYDLGLHDAYLILAAKNAGLDTLIMGLRNVDVIRDELKIPDEEAIVSVIAVGFRNGDPVFRPRKPIEEVAHFF